MATYKIIQNYIRQKYGFTAKSCWIADVKSQHGVPMRIAANRKNPNIRKYPCPARYLAQVEEALRHFTIIR